MKPLRMSNFRKGRLLTAAVLLTSCAALLLPGGSGPGAGQAAAGGGGPACRDGAERNCVVGGKRGTQFCFGGRWSQCQVEDSGPPPLTGTVRPKFLVLTVVYAPPGTDGGRSASSVTYGSGSTTGTTVSSGRSFKQNYSVSVSAEGGVLGTGGSVGASFGYSRSTSNSDAVEIKKSATTEISDTGPPRDGLDHDRDIIYLWLNPSVRVTVTPTWARWMLDQSGTADIQYLYVGWLKNPSLIPPGVAQRLQTYGITSQDFPSILRANPLADGAAAPDPNRYQMVNTTFPYEPPFAQGDPVPTFKLVLSHANTLTTSSTTQNEYSIGATVSGSVNFLSLFKASAKNQNTWTWTCTSTRASTSGTTESASVTVGGPSFGYTGPTDMGVYYDTVYKTFAFAPIISAVPALRGTVSGGGGRPAPWQEVTVVANRARYRTFTNARGEYRVYGRLSGPLQVRAGRTVKRLIGVPASRRADLTLP